MAKPVEHIGAAEHYIQVRGELFEAVQEAGVFPDSKTFVDCVPQHDPEDIMDAFAAERGNEGIDLRTFVEERFFLPDKPGISEETETGDMDVHIRGLWSRLMRPAHSDVNDTSTLIPLQQPYVVPGGRFRETYYWDAYFTALGLRAHGRFDAVEDMINNFGYMIDRFGFVPNGNRIYYLSRSQPPVFSLMVELLENENGRGEAVDHLPQVEEEHGFWMDGHETLGPKSRAYRRVVKLPNGAVLNRYWDDRTQVRPESYREDLERASNVPSGKRDGLFRNIRAACETGWDFSSRWMAGDELDTLQTTDLLPVDLNAYLYRMETNLARWYEYTGQDSAAARFRETAKTRKQAVNRYCWDEEAGFYFDHNWQNGSKSETESLAAVVPLFCAMSSQQQADAVAERLKDAFLMDGGLITTRTESGQQWDDPNGWAPLHWMAIKGLERYDHTDLADTIAERWLETNRAVYDLIGSMREKYNVRKPKHEAKDGEYPVQEGFGWTNGVAAALLARRQNDQS